MAIRHVAAVALLACAGVAHADPISSTSAPSAGFLNNWTTGNGTNVLGSGVLGNGNLNLVGGVSYGSSAKDVSLTDVLFGKAAGNIGQVDGETKLFFSRGIEGTYLLASGHGILAATLGEGKSVVGSADGALILEGINGRPGASGGGNAQAGNGAGSSGSIGSNGSNGSSGSGGNAGAGGSSGSNGSNGSSGASGNSGTGGNAGTGNNTGGGNSPFDPGNTDPVGNGGGQAQAPGQNAVDPTAIPEPSSIALMLAGLLGAGALSRRRKQ